MEPLVHECDVIFHLAASVGVKKIIEEPVRTIETNILGSHVIFSLAAKYNKKLLITSTSEVYGKNNKIPFSEDDDSVFGSTTKSRWSYACSKAIDEFLALAYHKKMGLPVIIMRLFNTVGPRQIGRYGMVIPTFISQSLAGREITVYGTGQQSRCFSYVTDVVKAMVDLMQHPRAGGEIFNIGTDEEITINDLAQRVKQKTKSNSTIVHLSYDRAYEPGFEDMERRVPDLTKIKRFTGYRPMYNIDESLDLIIAYMKNNKDGTLSR
jgi:UDP-glucose 4-epimerase